MGTLVGTSAAAGWVSNLEKAQKLWEKVDRKGQVNHSVCKWCYGDISLDEFCHAAKEIGLKSVELVGPEGWPNLKNTD
jgi:hydroxypyruvate isomerase